MFGPSPVEDALGKRAGPAELIGVVEGGAVPERLRAGPADNPWRPDVPLVGLLMLGEDGDRPGILGGVPTLGDNPDAIPEVIPGGIPANGGTPAEIWPGGDCPGNWPGGNCPGRSPLDIGANVREPGWKSRGISFKPT